MLRGCSATNVQGNCESVQKNFAKFNDGPDSSISSKEHIVESLDEKSTPKSGFKKKYKLMTIKEMRKHQWGISWSGGKDSTATIILMHEYGIPIKEIVYVRMMYDETTPATLPTMTNFVDRAAEQFRKWGYKVTIVPSIKTAKELIEKEYIRSKTPEMNGKKYGVTAFSRGFCKFIRVKLDTIKKATRSRYQMIGYCIDEPDRLCRVTDRNQSILATLKMTQDDAYDICDDYGLLSPIYEDGFARDGCFFCPNTTPKEIDFLMKNHPELAEKCKEMVDMCDYDVSRLADRNNWIKYFLNQNEDD